MATHAEILNADILIVDDVASNVELLKAILQSAGYTSLTSTQDPRSVCERHRENHYDLILLDLRMPGMDGFEVMEGLKEFERDGYLPVLVVTAEPTLKLRALQSGAKDFVSKPYDMAEVLMRVHNMVEVRLLHKEACANAERLAELALNDPLTGLANRRLLDDRLAMALVHAQRNKSAMAVIYLDLDGFKEINDTFGHGVGDMLLKEVSERLRKTVREVDTVARLGGDEFVIVLGSISGTEYGAAVAARAIAAISQPYEIEGHRVEITISAGVSFYPENGEEAETLMERADLALYQAKAEGKNTFQIAEKINGQNERVFCRENNQGVHL